jgi:hypothetical protein
MEPMKLIYASRPRAVIHIEASEETHALCGVRSGQQVRGVVGPTCEECRRIFREGYRSVKAYVGEVDSDGIITRTPEVQQ